MTLVVKKYFALMVVRERLLALPPLLVLVLPHTHPMLDQANQKATNLMVVVMAKVSRGNTRVPLGAKEATHQVGKDTPKEVPTPPNP